MRFRDSLINVSYILKIIARLMEFFNRAMHGCVCVSSQAVRFEKNIRKEEFIHFTTILKHKK